MATGTQGSTLEDIKRRRAASSPRVIRRMAQRGETTGEERALVRISRPNTRIITGQDDLSGWDDEELRHGMKRDRNGNFQGFTPLLIPKALHDEIVRRTLSVAHQKMTTNLCDAVDLLGTVVRDKNADNKDRLAAAKMIIDRVMGKDPTRIDVQVKAKWEEALEASVVNLDQIIETTATEVMDEDDGDEFDA